MGLFNNFPWTNMHELNLQWIVETLKKCYSPDNPPEAMVISVNGESGEVTLYKNAVIRFPDVQDIQWNMWRNTDGVSTGIQFEKGQPAKRIDGQNRIVIYDANNPPPYPVVSVNGETGEIELYTEAYVEFPDITDNNWGIQRKLNAGTTNETQVGIMFDDTGKAKITKDETSNDLYSENNPPPYPVTSVDGNTGNVITWANHNTENLNLPNASPTDSWSINREIDHGNLSIKLMYDDNIQTLTACLIFDDGVNTPTTIKLLTLSDIPSSSGVVSVNNQTGVVTLYGNNIMLSMNDPTDIESAISAINTAIESDIDALSYICNGDVHPELYTNQIIYIQNHNTLTRGFYRIMSGGLLANAPFVLNTNVKKITHNYLNEIITVERRNITLDNTGVGVIGWPENNNHEGDVLIAAFPNSWNATQVIFTNSAYAQIQCTGLAGTTALFNLIWVKPAWLPIT